MAEWSIALALKARGLLKGSEGSNPSSTAIFMEDQEAISLKAAIKTSLFLGDHDNAIQLSLELAKLRSKQGKYDKVHKILLFAMDLSKDRKGTMN